MRLVSMSRPGYGGSTTLRTASLLAVGRDTAALANHLGLDDYAVVGCSGGGPFAVATAIADPDGVQALGVVEGVGLWRLLDEPSSLPEERAMLALLDAESSTVRGKEPEASGRRSSAASPRSMTPSTTSSPGRRPRSPVTSTTGHSGERTCGSCWRTSTAG